MPTYVGFSNIQLLPESSRMLGIRALKNVSNLYPRLRKKKWERRWTLNRFQQDLGFAQETILQSTPRTPAP